MKNIFMHFKNSKLCATQIDMEHFTNVYGKIKKAARQKDDTLRKQNERANKRKTDEEGLRLNWATEKQEQRKKERES